MKNTVRFTGLSFFVILLVVSISPGANADTTYTYTGNSFTTIDDTITANINGTLTTTPTFFSETFVTGFFTTSTPLGPDLHDQFIQPTSYSFTDGVHVWASTLAYSQIAFFNIFTDNSGRIASDWFIRAVNYNYEQVLTTSSSSPLSQGRYGRYDQSIGTIIVNAQWNQWDDMVYTPGSWTGGGVPLPGALWLLGPGLVGLATIKRRFKK